MIRNTLLRNDRLFHLGQTAPEPQLRRRTRRTLLVVLALAVTGLTAVAMTPHPDGWLLLLGLIPVQGTFRWLAWRGTRGLALAPSHLLDELQLQQVHSAYRRAYGINIAVLAVLFTVFFWSHEWHPVRIGVVGLFLLLELMIWLPTAILAWRLDDEDPVEPEIAAA